MPGGRRHWVPVITPKRRRGVEEDKEEENMEEVEKMEEEEVEEGKSDEEEKRINVSPREISSRSLATGTLPGYLVPRTPEELQ